MGILYKQKWVEKCENLKAYKQLEFDHALITFQSASQLGSDLD